MSTLEPSSGGMGMMLNTASMMLIHTLATSMPTSGWSTNSGSTGTLTSTRASSALARASSTFAPGPARATSSMSFCGLRK